MSLLAVLMVCGLMMPVSAEEVKVTTADEFEKAIAEVTSERYTIVLGSNLEITKPVTIPSGKNITLDLGGYTLTLSGTGTVEDESKPEGYSYSLLTEGILSITNGTLTSTNDAIAVKGTFTIEKGATLKTAGTLAITNLGGKVEVLGKIDSAGSGIQTFGGEVNAYEGSEIVATNNTGSGIDVFNRNYDNESEGAIVVIHGGKIISDYYAVSTNNQKSNASNVTIYGGELTSRISAIYWPSAGELIIGTEDGNGPKIISKKGSGIEICAGTLVVNGGYIVGGSEMSETDSYRTDHKLVQGYRNNSGSGSPGDAITIISRRGAGYVDSLLSVTVNDGYFVSSQNYALRNINCNTENENQLNQETTVKINDGGFEGKIADIDAQFVEEDEKSFIYGGTFTEEPIEYLADGYIVIDGPDGTKIVVTIESQEPVEEETKPSISCAGEKDKNCDGVVTCDEEKGEGWTWNNAKGVCEYTGTTSNTYTVVNTAVK